MEKDIVNIGKSVVIKGELNGSEDLTIEGQVEGKQLTRAQELDYLRDFKKKFNLDYGFAISDSANNDRNYGVSSIPTTFLIDRRGVVRFISVGGSDAESSALGRMIKKLIEEPAPANVAAAASTLCCTANSLALGGPALGAIATEEILSKTVLGAGFKQFRRATETVFNRVFEARN